MSQLPPTLASMRRHDIGRNLLFVFVWLAWVGAALFTLLSLGLYQKRAQLDRPTLTPAERQSVTGWRMRHIVPGSSAITQTILQSIAGRGPRDGLAEEIWVQNETPFSRRLRAQGWSVHLLSASPSPDSDAGPRLEILSPAGEVRWSGSYQPGDFILGPAVLWDLRVLGAITQGRPFPPVVPAGCSTPEPVTGPAVGFAWLDIRPFSSTQPSASL